MKRPSFQFYPGDWQANSNLKRCTHAEKGVWLDVLCLMHDQPEYGVLRWPLKEIAQAVSCSVATLKSLHAKSILKGEDQYLAEPFIYIPRSGRKDGEPVTLISTQEGPIWYSSRMVKDEYIRTIRGESTRFGDESGETPKHSPKPPFGDGSSSSSSTSLSSSLRSEDSAAKPQRIPSRPKREEVTLAKYLENCKAAGVKPVPDGHAIRTWCEEAKIPTDMLQVAWVVFREKYLNDEKLKGKRYKDWAAHFATSVKDRWYGLWFTGEDGNPAWTSTGLQRKQVLEAQQAKAHKEVEHDPA